MRSLVKSTHRAGGKRDGACSRALVDGRQRRPNPLPGRRLTISGRWRPAAAMTPMRRRWRVTSAKQPARAGRGQSRNAGRGRPHPGRPSLYDGAHGRHRIRGTAACKIISTAHDQQHCRTDARKNSAISGELEKVLPIGPAWHKTQFRTFDDTKRASMTVGSDGAGVVEPILPEGANAFSETKSSRARTGSAGHHIGHRPRRNA